MKIDLTWDERQEIATWAQTALQDPTNDELAEIARSIFDKVKDEVEGE